MLHLLKLPMGYLQVFRIFHNSYLIILHVSCSGHYERQEKDVGREIQ